MLVDEIYRYWNTFSNIEYDFYIIIEDFISHGI